MDKAELLALLDDPDVRAALREATLDGGHLIDARTNDGRGRVALLTQVEVPVGTSPEAIKAAVATAVEPVVTQAAPDPRSPGVRAAVAAGRVVPGWIRKLPHEKAEPVP